MSQLGQKASLQGPEILLKVLGKPAYRFRRIGLEAGPLSHGSYHAGAFGEVVLAQGLGHADRQAPRDQEGDSAVPYRRRCPLSEKA